jgi:hypothetical protein
MPQRVPTTQVYSFAAPAVKGGDLVVPVCVGSGLMHGLRASVGLWRRAAQAVLAATEPEALRRARLSAAAKPDARFDDAGEHPPIVKPGGQLL